MAEPPPPRPVVLLVDDSLADRTLTRRALEAAGGPVELRMAENGEEALAYLRREGRFADPADSPRPDVILLDLNMPRMGGDELLALLRGDPDLRCLPVVILTSSELHRDIHASYGGGANAYLVKPVTAESFLDLASGLHRFWLGSEHIRTPKGDAGGGRS